ncbi:hypothetical protein EON63_21285, partial [archaeon]
MAVKIQGPDFDSAVLRWEGNVMQALAHTPHVPQFIMSGQYEKRDFIVMDLMNGEDMAHIRNRIRSASKTGLVPLPIVVYLCKQMLTCIEALHTHGYVHRDVKPSNFMQKTAEDTKFCVIDFGLVKQVWLSITHHASIPIPIQTLCHQHHTIHIILYTHYFPMTHSIASETAACVHLRTRRSSEGLPCMPPPSCTRDMTSVPGMLWRMVYGIWCMVFGVFCVVLRTLFSTSGISINIFVSLFRDDLCSIFHVFLDMVSGSLP